MGEAERRGADVRQDALIALGFFGFADRPSVIDKQERELRPVFFRNEFHQVLFDLDWVLVFREAKPI